MTSNRANFLASALRWLRAGYPEGIPTTDRVPLLALLRHRLTAQELDHIVNILVEQGDLPVSQEEIRAAVEQVSRQNPSDEDCARVSARLAGGGWPLSGDGDGAVANPVENAPTAAPASINTQDGASGSATGTGNANGTNASTRPAFLRAMIGWLRAGYPKGVPPQDYIPLLALLRRRLSDDEVSWVAHELVRESGVDSVSETHIGVHIMKLTDEMPSEADIERVRQHVEASGLLEPPAR